MHKSNNHGAIAKKTANTKNENYYGLYYGSRRAKQLKRATSRIARALAKKEIYNESF